MSSSKSPGTKISRTSAIVKRRLLPLAVLTGAAAAFASIHAYAQATPPAAATVLSFTDAQADRGEDLYATACAACHGATLGGGAEAPGLAGSGFRTRWFGGAANAFFGFISTTMPQQAPGTLEPQVYADIMAFIVKRNGYPAGETEIAPDAAALATMTFPVRPE